MDKPAEESKPTKLESETLSRYIHSNIYRRLVQDENDLTGLVAYGLYQARKRAWIADVEQMKKRTPTEEEVKEYCFTYGNNVLVELRQRAEDLIFQVSDKLLDERVDELQERAFNNRAISEVAEIKRLLLEKLGYRHHVIGHVLGFAILVGLAAFITFAVAHEPTIADFISRHT